MRNRINGCLIISMIISITSLAILGYIYVKGTPFQVTDTLFVVPKNVTMQEFSYETIEQYNKDHYAATYEIEDTSLVTALEKRVETKIIGTNAVYPFIYKIPVISGGFFTQEHEKNKNTVVVLNRNAAFQLFGGTDCIDNTLDFNNKAYTVVGVVDDGDKDNSALYYPSNQRDLKTKNLLISFAGATEDEVKATLNQLGVSKDSYLIENLNTVRTALLDKVWIGADLMTTILIVALIALLIRKMGIIFVMLRMALKKDYYPAQLIVKKFPAIAQLVVYGCLCISGCYYLLTVGNRYVIMLIHQKVNWDFIKKSASFAVMTDTFYTLHLQSNQLLIILLITVFYTIALYWLKSSSAKSYKTS